MANVVVESGSNVVQGRILQPWPSSDPALSGPAISFVPLPIFPVGFSAEMERVTALESKGMLPDPKLSPKGLFTVTPPSGFDLLAAPGPSGRMWPMSAAF